MALGFALVASSLIVVGVEISGLAGILNRPDAVSGVVSALALAALVSILIVPRATTSAGGRGLVAASAGSGPGPVLVFDPVKSLEARAVAASAAVVLLTWLPIALSRLALPPVAWDALTYHLAFPAGWLLRGDLATTVPASGDAAVGSTL